MPFELTVTLCALISGSVQVAVTQRLMRRNNLLLRDANNVIVNVRGLKSSLRQACLRSPTLSVECLCIPLAL